MLASKIQEALVARVLGGGSGFHTLYFFLCGASVMSIMCLDVQTKEDRRFL
jgi:hypothetical protein